MKKYLCFALVFNLVIAAPAKAQVPASAEPQQIQKSFDERRPLEKRKADIQVPVEAQSNLQALDKTKVLALSAVKFNGNTVYSDKELQEFTTPYVGKKVSLYDLNVIAASVKKKYRDDGYLLSKAVVSTQKIENNVVNIDVIEGYISEVNLNGDIDGGTATIQNYAEKISQIRPINKRDLERYMLLIDDLPGVTAKSLISPSTKVPGSAAMLINIKFRRYEPSISLDNYGTRFVGPYQATGVVAANSVFGNYGRTTMRAVTSFNDELVYGDVSHEELVGSEGSKFRGRYAQTFTNPGGRIEGLDIEGESQLLDLTFINPYLRSRKSNLGFQLGFKGLNSSSDVAAVTTAKDRARTIYAGASYEFTDGLDSTNLIDLVISHGINGLGSTEDGLGRSRANGKHEFNKVTAEFSRLQSLFNIFDIYISAMAQFSDSPLLASEEASVGGRKYGRGYDSGEITGDNAAMGAIELRYSDRATSAFDRFINNVQYYIFYDGGAVYNRNKVAAESSKLTLISAGGGVRFNISKDVTGDLTIGVPLTRKVNSEGDDSKSPRGFFSLTKRF